ncbi:HIRAN domain-containing protein [Solibacillus silvestris]|uniref:HIRAN domain-containing protein n=1 Tax=Solibacillus silvestris TaxID=76853 RepID=UPI003F811A2B
MRQRPFELWLIWQNVETRQRYHVGRLLFQDGVYTFKYETNGYRRKLAEALEKGYRPHLAFPHTNKVYRSKTLFGPFARRVPDHRRPDYDCLLQELGLPADSTEMDVLRATGGILATDSYEFVAPIFVENQLFDLEFFVAGWRYYGGEHIIDQLQRDQYVDLLLDPTNPEDPKAVLVKSANGEKLGFIPAFYSGWMYEMIQSECSYRAKIEAIYPDAVPHRKVNISIYGELNPSMDIKTILNDNEQLLLVVH